MADAPPPGTQAVQRVARILRVLGANNRVGLKVADIAFEAELERPTAHRLLLALCHEGLARQDADRRFFLGPFAYELGLAAAPELDLRAMFAPALNAVAEESGDTTFLTVRSRFDTVCLDRREGTYPIKALTVEVGARRPMGTTAGGIALLASLPQEEAREVIAFNAPRLPRYGRINAEILTRLVERARELGYALNFNDITPGVSGIGVVVPERPGLPPLALGIAAISSRLEEDRRAEVVALMRREAERAVASRPRGAARGG
ncbi:IclR family transcriptional regulator [Xanthobacter tagetidis]|jgi:DNA-binding IclR family transcriptional regulator|uniref:IclR family transcriptional regulator n=1 Tax=Xanthobacter tagetidis TaxID=60216 RepID=A0A3L7A4B8_9HYPH|nr:IclR family transcriptional regulator [Xanthobacter tagetidis]MBB6310035.1 DNA-binding IclR family transcriptional regulator [Xanthobacter tagetidis]RLP75139.1 IclR family transcriptional regulator [Xanthobacter tagetidis]